jgi:hypothetical protein
METCQPYKPWHDKVTHETFLRPDTGYRPQRRAVLTGLKLRELFVIGRLGVRIKRLRGKARAFSESLARVACDA